MRGFILVLFVLSSVFANVCEDNKNKIEDKILWQFISMYDEVELCKTLHSMYPQMKANECQVAKVTKVKRSEGCELLAGIYSLYGIKVNKNDCKYTQTNEYVKDIQNLPNVLKKYVFDVKAITELSTPDECIAVSSVKYKYAINNELIEKIKISLKKLDKENETYLKFMKDKEFKDNVLRIYSFIGDKLLEDFDELYDRYNLITATMLKYDSVWTLPIEHEVINWQALEQNEWNAIWLDNYVVKCYKKSPDDSINIRTTSDYYGDDGGVITCKELERKLKALGKIR